MTDRITVMGMVLSVMPVGEYDRRLVILTKERGKISAFAKGARRQNSPFLACSQPFVFGTFTLFEGRTSYTLSSVEVGNFFPELRGSVEFTFYGLYFCEVADYLTSEGNDEREILKLMYQSLRALSHAKIGVRLTRLIFEWKMFYLNGEGPQVASCVYCRKEGAEGVFRVRAGGLVCAACAEKPERRAANDPDYHLSEGAWYALRFIASTPPERLFTFTLTDEVQRELCELAAAYRGEYLRHAFHSLELLETVPVGT